MNAPAPGDVRTDSLPGLDRLAVAARVQTPGTVTVPIGPSSPSTAPVTAPTGGSSVAREPLMLSLTKDGRLPNRSQLDRIARAMPAATDAFVFCHGWLHDEDEARREAARFFALLDVALIPLRERVRPLRIALHWPSKPFADSGLTRAAGNRGCRPGLRPGRHAHASTLLAGRALTRIESARGLWPELERSFSGGVRSRAHRLDLARVLRDLHETEIPQGPEEEAELDALARRVATAGRQRGALPISPLHALSFWVMKRRAGEVGERFGHEHLAPLWRSLSCAPRLHLVGHSFGAKLVTSMVLGGVRPESLTLLLGAFSAFAFAPEVPGFRCPGSYHPVLAERQVAGPIVVLRSDHDRALGMLYRTITGSGQVDRHVARTHTDGTSARGCLAGNAGARALVPQPKSRGRAGRMATAVATSALGAAGARGVGAPELDLVDVQQVGIPHYPIVNIDGSRVACAKAPFIGAHRDIHHAEVANLVLLAAGYLVGGPTGIRPRPLDPCLSAVNLHPGDRS